MMNEDLRGLSGLMRDKGFTRPQGYAPGGAVMQMDPDGTKTQTMQAPQGMKMNLDIANFGLALANPKMGAPPRAEVMQITPDQSRSLDMRARQEMQKQELMGQLINLVGGENPEVIQILKDAPISELMKAVQEIQEANATVTSTSQ